MSALVFTCTRCGDQFKDMDEFGEHGCCKSISTVLAENRITKLRAALETIRDKCPHFHCMAKKYRDVIEEALK